MPWYKILLTEEQIIGGKVLALTFDFAEAQIRAGAPPRLILFNATESSPQLDIYFLPPNAMPSCKDFLIRYSAQECDRPDRSSITVAVGKFADIDFWFS